MRITKLPAPIIKPVPDRFRNNNQISMTEIQKIAIKP
jgi:hypothetical protein